MNVEELGFRVLKQRRHHGWTQAELARLAGISTASVTRIERGRHVPDMATLSAVASALGVSLADLVDGAASSQVA